MSEITIQTLACNCALGCLLAEPQFIRSFTKIKGINFDEYSDVVDYANTVIENSVLGFDCVFAFCAAIKTAEKAAFDTDGENSKYLNYMSSPYKDLIDRKTKAGLLFSRIYARLILYSWDNFGHSVTQKEKDGRMTNYRPIQDGGKQNVSLRQARFNALQLIPIIKADIQRLRQSYLLPNAASFNCCLPNTINLNCIC